ncbi:MAG TPA: phosphotransferase [Tepidisphaeraceae bacterium]
MNADLDIEREAELERYLRDTGRIAPDEKIDVKVLAGGVSNRTVWVRRASGECWVLKQALAKLRVKVDWFADPRRVQREAMGLRFLANLAPAGAITPLVFEDPHHHLLAMQAVCDPHQNWKTMLLAGDLQPHHVCQFARILAQIHRNAFEQRDRLAQEFQDRSFFESLRIEPYYLYSAEHEPRAQHFLHNLVDQTRATRRTLVHGDYSPKNILVHQDKLVLLDHEVIHFGEPAFDVGFAMTHLLSKAHHLPSHRNQFAEAAHLFWQTYRTDIAAVAWSTDIEPRSIRHTIACLLARVVGRSPLEYLDEQKRNAQREAAVALINTEPAAIPNFIERFLAYLSSGNSGA